MSEYRLGFIGAGKLAGSIIRGLLQAGFCMPHEIIASEPFEQTRKTLQTETEITVTTDNSAVAAKAGSIFIGVKPGVVLGALRDLSAQIENKLVVSLAAGVRLQNMEAVAPARFMRALTNTPSAICRAATGITKGARTTAHDVDLVRSLFGSIGVVVEVTEEQIDVVTALSGSGPAFVYAMIEAMGKGGEKLGLSPDVALTLATQTFLGAAQLAGETKVSPQDLIKMVVTPGGTTAAGLAVMDKMKTAESLIAAVEAATKRGQEMARENS
jgi:pyrroline-5-carboxylate reductase